MNITFQNVPVDIARRIIQEYDTYFLAGEYLSTQLHEAQVAKVRALEKKNGKGAKDLIFDAVVGKAEKYRIAYKKLGSYTKVAKKYGVSAATVWGAVNRGKK